MMRRKTHGSNPVVVVTKGSKSPFQVHQKFTGLSPFQRVTKKPSILKEKWRAR
jgi:hypothetical protein